MRVALLAVLVACTGCNQILGIGDFHVTDDSQPPDGDEFCLGQTVIFRYCPLTAPTGTVSLSTDIDTDNTTTPMCATDSPAGLCVIAGDTIMIDSLHASGTLPLVLVATHTIVVNGTLDASSQHQGRIGAGANAAALCASPAGTDAAANGQGGGGGAGGSFGGLGGDGSTSGQGKAGGAAPQAETTTAAVHAGCAGGNGGIGDNLAPGGSGGAGGGAVFLVAGTSIDVTSEGNIYASGAAGLGANNHAGGGGGGAGGMIGLDAPMVTVEGTVTANGGAGGGGSSGSAGQNGGDGETDMFDQKAKGGSGSSGNAGDGGDGGATTQPANGGTATQVGSDGGGGGGGSVGIVWTHQGLVGTKVSPAPSMH